MDTMNRREAALESQNLSEKQYYAAAERGRNVVVTAGAGTGKTRTLVARYISLLADGSQPENVVAITFTDKAANEMRSRVRSAILSQAGDMQKDEDKHYWEALEQRMDSARIGTIHSLCTEILRNHPAEAGIDPKFTVLDEPQSALLAADAVAATLEEILQMEEFQLLFEFIKVRDLEKILLQMLKKRLALRGWERKIINQDEVLRIILEGFLQHEVVQSCVQELSSFSLAKLAVDTTPLGAEKVLAFNEQWAEMKALYSRKLFYESFKKIIEIRAETLKSIGGKANAVSKMLLQDWRDTFDQELDWLKEGVDPELETKLEAAVNILKNGFRRVEQRYAGYLDIAGGLDFDDLEEMALNLLREPQIAGQWQRKIDALLVDEFQDTNQRQREIVELLTEGRAGKLFVVGDARQSIYRFRGADVTVFREVQRKTAREGGLDTELSESHRTQPRLSSLMDDILAASMGTEDDAGKLYQVPFSRMTPKRKDFPDHIYQPFTEVLIGAGGDSEEGRLMAANLLADKLLAYKQVGEIRQWSEVALLFRAASAFTVYEQALEEAGIPFMTIAGSGFYERPEIRDLLNSLRAISDPWDDLAMAGFLRSPIVGLSDNGITRLRWSNAGQVTPLRQSLDGDLSSLTPTDQRAAKRALVILEKFVPMSGSVPVGLLLHRLIQHSHIRVILAGTGNRGWRNVEKLLMDAYDSKLTSIHTYLEYVQEIHDTGVREGEAAGGNENTVQLMTIHKSKGLEFPWVVLADAGRKVAVDRDAWLVVDDMLSMKASLLDYKPLLFRYLKKLNADRDEAETKRVFYVALTRARDKLIISGHISLSRKSYFANGWMKFILDLYDQDPILLGAQPGSFQIESAGGEKIGFTVQTNAVQFPAPEKIELLREEVKPGILLQPVQINREEKHPIDEPGEISGWKIKQEFERWVGAILHHALQLWDFQHDHDLQRFLEQAAFKVKIIHFDERKKAVEEAFKLITRLKQHPIFLEIQNAQQRFHELPFAVSDQSIVRSGRLDVLYRSPSGWKIIDFKTDRLNDLNDLSPETKEKYRMQIVGYQEAVLAQIAEKPQAYFCFLNYQDRIELVSIDHF